MSWIKLALQSHWIVVLPGVLLISGILLILSSTPGHEVVGTTTEAQQAKEVKKIDTLPLQIELIKVFKPEAKAKLDLPPSVVKDVSKHVIAATKVKDDGHPHTISTVIDSTTGESTTYIRKDPLPWLAVTTRTHISAYYGIKDGDTIVRIQGQQELLQSKALRIEAIASTDIGEDTSTFIGIGARFSF